MENSVKLKHLKTLTKSKWWEIVKNKMEFLRKNAALLIVMREWQSKWEYSLDDLYKRDIKTVNRIFNWIQNEIASLEMEVEQEEKSVEETELSLWDSDDLFKTAE